MNSPYLKRVFLLWCSGLVMFFNKWWFLNYIKQYGWRGWWCEKMNINSNHHPKYISGFRYGIGLGTHFHETLRTREYLERIILMCAVDICNFEPFRTYGICTIRGYADAGRQRYGDDFGEYYITPRIMGGI